MNQYKSTINIFGDDITTSKTMGSKGVPEFAMPKKDDASVLARDLLPLHNKRDDRFQTDIHINGKTKFEESNTIIKSLEEEIVTMKHKLSFVYEKDEEIGKLKETINDLKKEVKELQGYSSECVKLRLDNNNLKEQLTHQSISKNENDKLMSENKNLRNKIKELTKDDEESILSITDDETESIVDISTDTFSQDSFTHDSFSNDSKPKKHKMSNKINKKEEFMDINISQLRSILFTRLQDKQTKHIDNLIDSYNLKNMNKVKKSVLEKMLEEAIHL